MTAANSGGYLHGTRAIYDRALTTGTTIMKPDYRITLAISSVLIVAALLFPPWKGPYAENFIGFYFVFEDEANLPYRATLDFPRLTIEVICIALFSLLIHLSLHIPVIWRAQLEARRQENAREFQRRFGICPHCKFKVPLAASSCDHCGTRFLGDYCPIVSDVPSERS